MVLSALYRPWPPRTNFGEHLFHDVGGHRLHTWGAYSWKGAVLRDDGQRMSESQLAELQNMRVLLEEARGLARNLTYHRWARLEMIIGQVLDEVDRQIEELRSEGRG